MSRFVASALVVSATLSCAPPLSDSLVAVAFSPQDSVAYRPFDWCEIGDQADVIAKWQVESWGDPVVLTFNPNELRITMTPVQLRLLDLRKGASPPTRTVYFAGELRDGRVDIGPLSNPDGAPLVAWGAHHRVDSVELMLSYGWLVLTSPSVAAT